MTDRELNVMFFFACLRRLRFLQLLVTSLCLALLLFLSSGCKAVAASIVTNTNALFLVDVVAPSLPVAAHKCYTCYASAALWQEDDASLTLTKRQPDFCLHPGPLVDLSN